MKVDILLGLQWGDEGKGKVVDVLAPRYDVVARFQGGPNAGHTIEYDGHKFILHIIPSGIFNPRLTNLIGNGVIIDPCIFNNEIVNLDRHGIQVRDNLFVSRKSHLILPTHRLLDATLESSKGASKIGSTLKGIGPAYTDKIARNGLRTGDLLLDDFRSRYNAIREHHLRLIAFYGFDSTAHRIDGLSFPEYEEQWCRGADALKGLQIVDGEYYINRALGEGKKVLAEGAQGTLLAVDFGTYPFVTSSTTVAAGACSGLGVPPARVGEVFGIFKAYCTRVGSGEFPTELTDATGERIRKTGNEFGATTGRPRRCGWLDITALKYSIMLNGVTALLMTKADVLNGLGEIRVGMAYKVDGKTLSHFPFEASYRRLEVEYRSFPAWPAGPIDISRGKELPKELKDYIAFIQNETSVPVKMVSVGPDRKQIIEL